MFSKKLKSKQHAVDRLRQNFVTIGLEAGKDLIGDNTSEVELDREGASKEKDQYVDTVELSSGSPDDFTAIVNMARDYMDLDVKTKGNPSNMIACGSAYIQRSRKCGVHILFSNS